MTALDTHKLRGATEAGAPRTMTRRETMDVRGVVENDFQDDRAICPLFDDDSRINVAFPTFLDTANGTLLSCPHT